MAKREAASLTVVVFLDPEFILEVEIFPTGLVDEVVGLKLKDWFPFPVFKELLCVPSFCKENIVDID